MTITEVAAKAVEIYNAHEEGAAADAGFDAGELSGPAHARMADEAVEKLAADHGFTLEEVVTELYRQVTEEPTEADLDYAYRVHGGSKMS